MQIAYWCCRMMCRALTLLPQCAKHPMYLILMHKLYITLVRFRQEKNTWLRLENDTWFHMCVTQLNPKPQPLLALFHFGIYGTICPVFKSPETNGFMTFYIKSLCLMPMSLLF